MSLKNPVLKADNVSRHYSLGEQTVHALRGVTLEITRAEFVAVMGPSGSGKSTLLHLLGLVDQPSEGDIVVDGQSTKGLDDDALTALRRDKLGFVFQSFELIPTLSAAENIILPAEIAGRGKQAKPRLDKLAAQLGISDRLGHRPNQLSGGQRQRVALARALINDPLVILADEPTGNLDTDTGNDVLELLKEGVETSGWTVVMVTHDPHAAAFAERVVRLRDGQVEEAVEGKTLAKQSGMEKVER